MHASLHVLLRASPCVSDRVGGLPPCWRRARARTMAATCQRTAEPASAEEHGRGQGEGGQDRIVVHLAS
jgi:hypothetical protein